MAKPIRVIHICMTCHRVGEEPTSCHAGQSRPCDVGDPGNQRRLPLFDARGNLLTRAPKWWVEACFKAKVKVKRQK